MEPFRTKVLSNGLTLEIFDASNRYFGDYWRVCLDVRCRIPVTSALTSGSIDSEQARVLLGDAIVFNRTLEKMGVAGGEVGEVREALIEQFLATAGTYLENPDFPVRFVRQQLAERKRGRRPFLVPK